MKIVDFIYLVIKFEAYLKHTLNVSKLHIKNVLWELQTLITN